MVWMVEHFMVDHVPYRFEGSTIRHRGRLGGEGHLWRMGRFLSRITFPLTPDASHELAMSDEPQRVALIQGAMSWPASHLPGSMPQASASDARIQGGRDIQVAFNHHRCGARPGGISVGITHG